MKDASVDNQHLVEKNNYIKAKRQFYRVWAVIGVLALLALTGKVVGVLSGPVAIVVWAAVIVVIFGGLVDWLEEKKIPRWIGIIISYIILFAVVFVLVMVMFSPVGGVGSQFALFMEDIPHWVERMGARMSELYDSLGGILNNEVVAKWVNTASESLVTWANSMAKNSATGIVNASASILDSLMIITFALVVAFWLLLEWPAIRREARRLVPERHKEDVEMMGLTISRAMNGFIRATLIQCLLIGTVSGIAYAIIGVSYSGPLAVIAGLFNVVPVVGHWIGLVLVTLITLFQSPLTGFLVFLVTLIIQEFVYFFVQPKLMANSVDVHPVLVILAMFIGSSAGGALYGFGGSVAGMLVSIPFAAVAKALFVYYYERKTGLQVVSEDGVFFKGVPSRKNNPRGELDPCADAIAAPPLSQGATARLFKPQELRRLIENNASHDTEHTNDK